MYKRFSLGHHYIELSYNESKTLELFYSSGTNHRIDPLTGSKELSFVYSKDWENIPEYIVSLTEKGILNRYHFDDVNLYLVDNDARNFKEVKTKEDFKRLFSDDSLEFSSFNSFIDTLKDTIRLYKYYGFYRMNKDLVKRLFYENRDSDKDSYREDFYSSTQEFVDDQTTEVSTDIVGEIKTKQFQKYGNIRKYT